MYKTHTCIIVCIHLYVHIYVFMYIPTNSLSLFICICLATFCYISVTLFGENLSIACKVIAGSQGMEKGSSARGGCPKVACELIVLRRDMEYVYIYIHI